MSFLLCTRGALHTWSCGRSTAAFKQENVNITHGGAVKEVLLEKTGDTLPQDAALAALCRGENDAVRVCEFVGFSSQDEVGWPRRHEVALIAASLCSLLLILCRRSVAEVENDSCQD